jgi:hypothetical protein
VSQATTDVAQELSCAKKAGSGLGLCVANKLGLSLRQSQSQNNQNQNQNQNPQCVLIMEGMKIVRPTSLRDKHVQVTSVQTAEKVVGCVTKCASFVSPRHPRSSVLLMEQQVTKQ